jgi:hypothetical protein
LRSYVISASVVDNGDSYTVTGTGVLAAGPIQGEVTAEITTDSSFNIDPSSLNISGQATVDKEMAGVHINLEGTLENGRLASLAGSIEGMGGAYVIAASLVDNGDGYTITGAGNCVSISIINKRSCNNIRPTHTLNRTSQTGKSTIF